jgi:hypothetical protein
MLDEVDLQRIEMHWSKANRNGNSFDVDQCLADVDALLTEVKRLRNEIKKRAFIKICLDGYEYDADTIAMIGPMNPKGYKR